MDQFNLAIYSGLYATHSYMQKAYPHLKETKGSVVNFASGAGLFGNYGQCSYAAAKEGIRGLTRVAANEARTASTSTSCARLLGLLRSRTSRMPIPRRSRPTSTCRRLVTTATSRRKSAAWSFSSAVPTFKYMNGETVTLEGGMGQRP